MNRQIKGLLYYFAMDIRYSLLIFWTILLSILLVFLVFSYYLLTVEDGGFFFGFPFAIYFYCGVLGFLAVKENIPFALKMGATRKNFFIANGLFFLGLALLLAIVANTIQTLVSQLTASAGIHTFHFLHIANFLENTWINRVIVDTSIMFLALSVMFIVGLIFYKYGLAGGGIATGALAVFLLFGIAQGWIFDFFIELFASFDMMFFYQILAVSLVLYCLSFIFLRKVTIVKTK